jgi:signal transduction histidine kinase
VRTQLRAADREVDRLAQIIERLLTMASQIEEGRTTQADLGDAVDRAVLRWEERAARASSTLSGSTDGDSLSVEADPDDVDQVLDVLIDNALTYAPGPVELSASAHRDRAVVSVADRGPGIPADEVAMVTERFFRGRGASPGGSGLGLAIARELAERWAGSLDVRADAGGTRVDVWFRAASHTGPRPAPGSVRP